MAVKIAPSCPLCHGPMVERKGKFSPFFGCTSFPKCRGTVNIKFTKAPAAPVEPRQAIIPSDEQAAIFDYGLNGKGHLVIDALAGVGKSTTCRELMFLLTEKFPHLKVAYTTFGKDAVAEFKTKAVPAGVEIATTNSLGHRIVTSAYRKATLDNNKVKNLISEVWQPCNETELNAEKTIINTVSNLVGLCQSYLLDGDRNSLDELALRHEVEFSVEIAELVYKLVPQVLELDKKRPIVFSYSDQLWLPVVLNLAPVTRYDILMLDEAQDLNKVQHQLAMRLLAPGGRLIIVGDNNQAIYGFRGSDVDSIPNLAALLAETFPQQEIKTLPLNTCRRCPKSHIALAQAIVPAIRAMENAPDGEIIRTTLKDCEFNPGDMVICRTNAPLAPIAYSLIRKGVKAIIRGRDIGQGLITLIDALRAKSVNELLVKLDAWVVREIANAAGTRREDTVTQTTNDKADCIRAFSEDVESISEIKTRIVSVFADFDAGNQPKGTVVLSSIHRAKGLEAQRVVWACPEIEITCSQEWQAKQESNLEYVALTRSKYTLVFAAGR